MALIDKLTAIAEAIRSKTGKTDVLTLEQMVTEIGAIDTQAQTYILVDEDGNEIPAVLVDEPVEITATANDIRLGVTAVTNDGVTEGTKDIPSYHTTTGHKIVTNGSKFVVAIPNYDYTELQALFCPYDKSVLKSVAADKVVIADCVYPVQSNESESTVIKDYNTKRIDFGIANNSGKHYLIRYISYKEIY